MQFSFYVCRAQKASASFNWATHSSTLLVWCTQPALLMFAKPGLHTKHKGQSKVEPRTHFYDGGLPAQERPRPLPRDLARARVQQRHQLGHRAGLPRRVRMQRHLPRNPRNPSRRQHSALPAVAAKYSWKLLPSNCSSNGGIYAGKRSVLLHIIAVQAISICSLEVCVMAVSFLRESVFHLLALACWPRRMRMATPTLKTWT